MSKTYEYDVFLSHSSRDKAEVRELAERLKGDGLHVWLDEWMIQPGDLISLAIEQGLDNSRTLLLVMSHNAFNSDWVTLEHHTALFRDPTNKQRRFIPVLLEDCEIKDTLKQFCYVDWREKDDAEYERLLVACSVSGSVWDSVSSGLRFESDNSSETSFPYEYGSHLHWLWGWGYRLRCMLDDDTYPSKYTWMVFRPCRQARNAMMQFSIQFPHIIKQIDDYLGFAETRFQELLDNDNSSSQSNFVAAMDSLCERIETAAPLIAENLAREQR